MLVPYRAMLFFPGGGPAAGASIGVSIDGSNQAPALFQDAAATLPQVNPVVADGMGNIMFFAPPGLYIAEIAGTFTRINVDPAYLSPVWPDVFVFEQVAPALVWTVDHHFGTHPSVDVVTPGGAVEVGEVTHVTASQATITFGSPMAGTAYLRR